MANELDSGDALLRSITELRGMVDRLIGEQITRVRALEDDALVGAPLELCELGSERHLTALMPLVGSASKTRSEAPATLPERTNNHHAPAVRKYARKTAAPEPTQTTTVERNEDDSKQRLDALAKHLDDRLRKARDSTKDRSKPSA
jgi:hypothetical protein